MRDEPPQNSPLLAVPKVAIRMFACRAAPLAGNYKNMPMALSLTMGEEAAQLRISVLLTQAVQIEPRVDLAAAASNSLADTMIERSGRGGRCRLCFRRIDRLNGLPGFRRQSLSMYRL
jgi:hypothetical protein